MVQNFSFQYKNFFYFLNGVKYELKKLNKNPKKNIKSIFLKIFFSCEKTWTNIKILNGIKSFPHNSITNTFKGEEGRKNIEDAIFLARTSVQYDPVIYIGLVVYCVIHEEQFFVFFFFKGEKKNYKKHLSHRFPSLSGSLSPSFSVPKYFELHGKRMNEGGSFDVDHICIGLVNCMIYELSRWRVLSHSSRKTSYVD